MYATADQVVAYAAARGVTIEAPSASALSQRASDIIDRSFTFKGTPLTPVHAWPRDNMPDSSYNNIVPVEVTTACCAVALDLHNGLKLEPSGDSDVIRESLLVTGISFEYGSRQSSYSPPASALAILRSLILSNGQLRLSR